MFRSKVTHQGNGAGDRTRRFTKDPGWEGNLLTLLRPISRISSEGMAVSLITCGSAVCQAKN